MTQKTEMKQGTKKVQIKKEGTYRRIVNIKEETAEKTPVTKEIQKK